MERTTSYRNIFKATSIFGGVQVLQILVSLIRGKLIAVLLGASGIGISSLLTTSLSIITTISGMGLNSSAIKDIALAKDTNDQIHLSKIIEIFKKLLLISCIIGASILIIGSRFLSQYSFGNNNYTSSFMLLSFMIVPTILSQGNTAILQGNRNLLFTAKLSMWSSIVSVLFSLPFYYFYGIKGILPALILPQWLTYFLSIYYVRKLRIEKVNVDSNEVFLKGKFMVKLGFTLMVSVLLGQVTTYLLNLFISNSGSVADVGYMNAAIGMTTTVISMVFSAMGNDYFPRLASVCDDSEKMSETVNRQGEILLLIVFPILISFSLFSNLVIKIFLSADFIKISNVIKILAFGMLIKAASYPLGYISFAKGDKKTFFLFEAVWGNLISLIFNIVGYHYFGLTGLGYSFVVSYTLYIILVALIAKYKYRCSLSIEFLNIGFIVFGLSSMMLINGIFFTKTIFYLIGITLMLISILFSYSELNKRLELKYIVESIKRKFTKSK